jgi:hypothetical protein
MAIKFNILPHRETFYGGLIVDFTVEEPEAFIFWRNALVPDHRAWDLYVIPAYHPVMNGRVCFGSVNGDTDEYINRKVITHIYCPNDAKALQTKIAISSWGHVNHPFRASGKTFSASLNKRVLLSNAGELELSKVLRAALNLDNSYIQVIGGFHAPLRCAHNRLLDTGRRSPWPNAVYNGMNSFIVRGSEQHCVWTHMVLTEEGEIEKAYIPSWFMEEGWLEIYQGAEVSHELY